MKKQTNWYVLFVMGGQETKICEFLNQEESWYAFYPKIEFIKRKNSIDFLVEKPMFPSYIFVKSNDMHQIFRDKLNILKNRKTGIIKELNYKDEIPALYEEEKIYLTGLLDENYTLKKSSGLIKQDKVVILDGPLKGYESHISKIDRHKRKAVLEVDMLHKKIKITVPLEIIQRFE